MADKFYETGQGSLKFLRLYSLLIKRSELQKICDKNIEFY